MIRKPAPIRHVRPRRCSFGDCRALASTLLTVTDGGRPEQRASCEAHRAMIRRPWRGCTVVEVPIVA